MPKIQLHQVQLNLTVGQLNQILLQPMFLLTHSCHNNDAKLTYVLRYSCFIQLNIRLWF